MEDLKTSDPKEHAENIRSELQKLTDHIRSDIQQVDDPQAKALFETSAEVLTGLITAYSHFKEKEEEAWE